MCALGMRLSLPGTAPPSLLAAGGSVPRAARAWAWACLWENRLRAGRALEIFWFNPHLTGGAMAEEDKADLAPGLRPGEGCAWAQLESPPFPPSAWLAAFRFIINPEGSRAER